MDAAEGLWAYPWLGGTGARVPCAIRYFDTKRWVFERYDGSNCNWRPGFKYRSLPMGYVDEPMEIATRHLTQHFSTVLPRRRSQG
jgi:hypothetical protein